MGLLLSLPPLSHPTSHIVPSGVHRPSLERSRESAHPALTASVSVHQREATGPALPLPQTAPRWRVLPPGGSELSVSGMDEQPEPLFSGCEEGLY